MLLNPPSVIGACIISNRLMATATVLTPKEGWTTLNVKCKNRSANLFVFFLPWFPSNLRHDISTSPHQKKPPEKKARLFRGGLSYDHSKSLITLFCTVKNSLNPTIGIKLWSVVASTTLTKVPPTTQPLAEMDGGQYHPFKRNNDCRIHNIWTRVKKKFNMLYKTQSIELQNRQIPTIARIVAHQLDVSPSY